MKKALIVIVLGIILVEAVIGGKEKGRSSNWI